MSESRLNYLFRQYFTKMATPDEREELMDMLEKAEYDEQVKKLLTTTWLHFKSESQLFSNGQYEEMLATILRGRGMNKSVPVITKYKLSFGWLRTAAAAVLIFAVAGIYILLYPKHPRQSITQSQKVPAYSKITIVPGGNKAVLTLSDHSSIVLDSTHQGTLALQGNTKVVKLNTATLAYNVGNQNSKQIVYNTLSTPSGGQYQLILPDGTKAWLNASSSIHFPTVFKGKERNVSITGEIYFEVAKNAAMPFKISYKDVEVAVLGTHLDIMAYEDENSMSTTLLEGSVKVTKGSLTRKLVPGQQSNIKKNGDIKITEANVEEVMAWKNGWFQFNAYDIEKVMRQIARWYDVEVVYTGKIPPGHFTCLINRSNNITQVLKIMEAGGVRFRINGRKVIVLS